MLIRRDLSNPQGNDFLKKLTDRDAALFVRSNWGTCEENIRRAGNVSARLVKGVLCCGLVHGQVDGLRNQVVDRLRRVEHLNRERVAAG
jgi:hypothetical protein